MRAKKLFGKYGVYRIFLAFLFFAFLLLTTHQTTFAYYTNMPASVVIGQPDFTSSSSGTSRTSLWADGDGGLFVDNKGRLIVADHGNNRVLIWNEIPTENNAPADLVLGQPNFTSNSQGTSASTMKEPKQVYSDGNRLFVADRLNGRVLIWNTFPTQNGQAADIVVGQPDFTTAQQLCNQSNFNNRTSGVWVYDNKLLVLERNQNRVLIWNEVPTTNYEPADVVLGHSDFTTCTSESTSASSIGGGFGTLMVDSNGRLYLSDAGRNRVMVWNTIPTTNNTPADIVIGQPDFTTESSDATGNKLNGAKYLYSNGKRIFLSDQGNHRVLIYNSIPSTNGASADLVLGQDDFTSTSANGGEGTSATGFYAPSGIFEYDNKLIVMDDFNNRILVFDNIISTPGLDVDTSPEPLSDGRFKFKGNVVLGERDRYALQKVEVSVNGESFAPVTSLGGGRDDGPGSTRYEFWHEFSPWVSMDGVSRETWNSDLGYTLKVKASSFNADDSTLFFFAPFKFLSFTDGPLQTFKFSVPSKHTQRVRDNLDHFEIWVKKENGEWSQYVSDISTSQINTDTGEVSYSKVNTLSGGKYEIKVVAVSKDSGWRQDSNILTQELSGVSFNNPLSLPISSTLPLQLNSIAGANTGILSTFNIGAIKQSYTATILDTTFTGISYAFSEISLTVTNNETGEYKTYKTTVRPDSTFTLPVSLYPSSTIDISSYHFLTNQFNLLPSFVLELSVPVSAAP